ncbi:hypothetical protein NIES2119_29610 [[Phormidium ambiguum] IAM M-71]|uniref:H-type lectin domain-containing protein n=1 Tax=[Phormidium ambiguum] IAM M-71 TaxID=454136 RepID=A0A1U7I4G0_9CYAN|nr:H-type lectin domain-containing protein [Phormidium ambiguum]OKH31045.1 hypothetical protein NIES2119_29610 [Phormidium ambiguum IAM M-71]
MAQKIIYGTINDDGTKQGGDGFTVELVEAGLYAITFSQAFATPPCVVATLKDWGADNQIVVKNINPDQFQVTIWDLEVKQPAGATAAKLEVSKEKSAFNFIAIGEG